MEHDTILAPTPPESVEAPAEAPTPVASSELKRYACGHCPGEGKWFTTSLDLARHIKKEHPEVGKQKQEKRMAAATKTVVETIEKTDEQIYADIKIRGPDALADVLKARLSELLDAPNITTESKAYAIREWEEDPSLHFNFQALPRMLTDDAGIKPDKAMRIVEKLYMIYAKYAPALGAQAPGFYPAIQSGQPPYGHYGNYGGSPYPQQQTQYQPGQFGYDMWGRPLPPPQGFQGQGMMGGYGTWPQSYAQPPPLSEEKVSRLVEEHLDKKFQELKTELAPRENAEMVEMQVPVAYDEDGKPVMSNVKLSASMVPFLMMNRQPTPKAPEKSEEFKAMEKKMEELEKEKKVAEKEANDTKLEAFRKDIENNKSQMNERLKENQDTIKELTSALREARSSAIVGGYQNDSFRFLGQGLDKVAGLASERRPVELIIKTLAPEVPIPASEKPVPTTEAAAFEPLVKQGLVVES